MDITTEGLITLVRPTGRPGGKEYIEVKITLFNIDRTQQEQLGDSAWGGKNINISFREREGPPRTPPPEKESDRPPRDMKTLALYASKPPKLKGAASLEVDVLLDNIRRARERRIVAGAKEPNVLVMNGKTYGILINGLAAQPDGLGVLLRELDFDVGIRICNTMNDGEFVLLYEAVSP